MTGHLLWGIRRSLLDYVAGLPDGSMSFRDRPVATGTVLSFPLQDDSDWAAGCGILRFDGEFRSAGHFGMRLAVIAQPWIEVDGTVGTLSVRRWDDRPDRLRLAEFDWPEGEEEWLVVPKLTPLGTEAFGGIYPAGTELAPLTVRLR